jgi:hypothetical protein
VGYLYILGNGPILEIPVPVQNINVYVGYLYILGNGPILEIPVPVQNANVCGVYLIHSASEQILPGAEKKMQDH